MHSSPMLRFSLELYLSSLRLNLTNQGFDRKLAVLNLAQCVELAVKAALVEENESIYQKDGRTLNTHTAREALAAKWKRPFPLGARIELLVDERNAMQHRYGDVDPHTLVYHLDTVTEFLRTLLVDKFEMDLDDYVRLTDVRLAQSSALFITPLSTQADPTCPQPSDAQEPQGVAVEDLTGEIVAEFARFERAFRERAKEALGDDIGTRSLLDVTMKFAANVSALRPNVARIPRVFSLRNATVHGTMTPTAQQVAEARQLLAALVTAAGTTDNIAELREAARASASGLRGTKLPVKSSAMPDTPAGDEPPATTTQTDEADQ